VRAVELAGQRPQLRERPPVIVLCPGSAQSPPDERTVASGRCLEHVAFFVPDAALDGRPLAEHVPDRLAERLRAIDDEQDALLRIEPALDQIREQRGRDGGVLGRAVPEPEPDA